MQGIRSSDKSVIADRRIEHSYPAFWATAK
jgi:hypothetical protein